MANMCFYQLKVSGSEENVGKFIALAQEADPGKPALMLSCGVEASIENDKVADGVRSCMLSGQTKWSLDGSVVHPAGLGENTLSLIDVSRDLGLDVEAFSEGEMGEGDQEHFVISKGEVLVEETIPYLEYSTDGEPDYEDFCEWREEWAEDAPGIIPNYSEEEFMTEAEQEDILHFGGYNWMRWDGKPQNPPDAPWAK